MAHLLRKNNALAITKYVDVLCFSRIIANFKRYVGNTQSYKMLFEHLPKYFCREVVVAQLVERSLPIPEVRGSNPVIGKNLLISNICVLSTVY